ncbi:MAG TPA: carboxypeptidase regulatory-like domain-containing protein, partial [Candidatus Marinimicrobia bacterium]|nr:carboxypeptidase regulatory-like domain-containing protein [Candidatus Neomarinimicrobiota bacterium]
MKKLYHIILIFSVSMLSLVLAGTDGTVRGKVTDTDGNPLPGAQIFIKELQLGAIAGSDGSYILLNIPVGTYAVTVSMMGYRKETRKNVHVIMDQTVWLNFTLPIAAVEGEAVEVIADRPIMDPGATAKKITVSDEAIAALPIRDVSELYSLQSGVVQVRSRKQAIPDHEERGLEEVHVRGGRSGE